MRWVWFVALLAIALCPAAAAQVPCGSIPGVTVQVSPSPAQLGQPITITLFNNSNVQLDLPDACLIDSVHPGTTCSTVPVMVPICAQVITPIPPGTSKSFVWDQKDDLGKQVAPGFYSFKIKFFTPGGSDSCCPSVEIVDPCPDPVHYGQGDTGTGGIVPEIGSVGDPQVGNQNFQIVLQRAVGGAPAGLFVGAAPASIPAPWGTFLVSLTPPPIALFFQVGGTPGAPGQGSAVIPAPIPNNPGLAGASAYLQALFQDPGSSGGISHTDGLRVDICP